MKYFAVIDTNVIISAMLNFRSVPGQIVLEALTGKITPLGEYLLDPKDAIFYEIVMESRKTTDSYLVTGNLKHFPVKPFIITPREMLNLIQDE